MAKTNLEELSIESLKKRLLLFNIVAVVIGAAAITATVLFFLQEERKYDLLLVGAGLGAALSSFQARTANKIKKELNNRRGK